MSIIISWSWGLTDILFCVIVPKCRLNHYKYSCLLKSSTPICNADVGHKRCAIRHHFSHMWCIRAVQYVFIVSRCVCVYVNRGMCLSIVGPCSRFFILCVTKGWTVSISIFSPGQLSVSYLILYCPTSDILVSV